MLTEYIKLQYNYKHLVGGLFATLQYDSKHGLLIVSLFQIFIHLIPVKY